MHMPIININASKTENPAYHGARRLASTLAKDHLEAFIYGASSAGVFVNNTLNEIEVAAPRDDSKLNRSQWRTIVRHLRDGLKSKHVYLRGKLKCLLMDTRS